MEMLREAIASIAASPDGAYLNFDVARILMSIADSTQNILATTHPLGFIHAELTPLVPDLPEGTRARLHVWTDSSYVSDELGLVHDHIWVLKSCVLIGALIDVTLVPVAAPDGEFAGFRVSYGTANEFRLEGRWHLTECARRRFGPGQVYTLPARVIHRTEVAGFPLVTLLVTVEENDDGLGPMIYSRSAESTGTSIRTRVPPITLAGLLRDLSRAV